MIGPIAFLWPPKELSPNNKGHWAAKARAVKKYRSWCDNILQAHGVKRVEAFGAKLTFTFHPPDNRARDTDNMLAAAKPLIDSISKTIGIDDSRFTYGEPVKAHKLMNGAVIVTIEPTQRLG